MSATPYADQNTAQQNAADASTSAKNLWQTALTEIKSTLDIFKTDDYYFYYEGLNRLNSQLTDFAKETEETIYLIQSYYGPDEGDITDLTKASDSISKFRTDSNTITDSDYVQELTINLSSLISKISQNNHSTHQNILSIDEYFSLHNQTHPSLSSINQQIDSTSISVSNAIATTKTSIADIDQAVESIVEIRKHSEQQATNAATRIADFNETLSLHLANHEEKNKDLINDNIGIGKKSAINIAKTLLGDNTEAADNKARELFWGLSFSDDFLMNPDLTQESLRKFEQHLEDLKNPLAEYNYALAELFEPGPDEVYKNGQIIDAGNEAEEQTTSESSPEETDNQDSSKTNASFNENDNDGVDAGVIEGSASSESGSTAGQTVEHLEITTSQRQTDVSGGDLLKLGYALKGNDNTGNPGGDASTPGVDSSGLTNVAVLGPNTFNNRTYTLEISTESLKDDWDLESADIVLKYDTQLFERIDADDITLGDHLTLEKGIVVDDDNGLIRIAAASLSNTVFNKGDSIDSEAIFASIKIDFDESYFESSDRTPDANGKFTFDGNPLGFELSANSDETVFTRTFTSDSDGSEVAGGAFTNREIQSLGDLKGNTTFDEGKINLYQAEIKFQEQGDGLVLGTKRIIGSETGFTNLIRKGDLISAKTNIENIGNSLAKDVLIRDAGNVTGASFEASRFLKKTSKGETSNVDPNSQVDLKGGEFKSQKANTHNPNVFTAGFIADIESRPEIADLVKLDLASVAVGDSAHTFLADISAAFDMGQIGSDTNILLATEYAADNNQFKANIRANLQSNNMFAANDAFLAAYSDGVNSYLVSVSSSGNVADNALLDTAEVSTIATFKGVGNINTLSKDGAFAGIINDAQPIDYPYDPSTQESAQIEIDVRITGEAGDVVDLTRGLFKVSAEDTEQNPNTDDQYYLSNKGSKNLITFQGDLNYDGRVSMKDLAYLNAGAARQQLVESTDESGNAVQVASDASYARDVDADFNGKIDLADLSILDADWGKTLHTGDEQFQGSSDLSWSELDSQSSSSTWDNDSFKDQNAIEADAGYIGSLEAPGTSGVIGSDGNQDGNNSLQAENFQDLSAG